MHVYFLQHHPDYGPDRFADWLTGMGHSYNICHLYLDEIPPQPNAFDALIILDGPDSALESDPYLHIKRERKLIQRMLSSSKPLLGIGYGGAMLAQALGAIVSPGTYAELGWHTVHKAPVCPLPLPDRFDVFQWHQDIFGLPEDALPIGSTAASPIQGFCWDASRVISLLFHIEVTAKSAQAITEVALEYVDSEKQSDRTFGSHAYIQTTEEMFQSGRRFDRLAPLLDRIMMSWLGLG